MVDPFLSAFVPDGRCKCFQGRDRDRTFDERVEFSAIEPYALALRATVDLDAVAVASRQGRVGAVRTSRRVVLTTALSNVLDVEIHVPPFCFA